ncbi:hypothetical protein SAMN06297144_1432 [Sphingomonas guangdongensis]|uniref:Uncharacterized protein n=1 Tax=Sphingomonas guangdongensis TaxID=1141890 RepID=A0A285QH48_9SPHN|nr:hypothetical protein SAMN06297144_1432 [Sphingomonas guangdongensis]
MSRAPNGLEPVRRAELWCYATLIAIGTITTVSIWFA